ncbi:MAG: hypothetical protein ACI4XB_01835 [Ruminococcus sp.]
MNLFSGVVLLGVILAVLTVGIWWKKGNVLEILVLGVVYWFCAWIVAGMGLFVLDEFRLFRCACATAGLIFLTGIGAVLVRRKRDAIPWRELVQTSWDIRPHWIPILVCCCGAVLIAVKHGFFGMGQDEGVYQTVAINFMNGITDRQQDFAEYHLLSDEQQSAFTESILHRLIGYDIGTHEYPPTVYDNDVSPVSGIYHGIPTFASILAMWGTIFGMAQMQGVQTVFYFCTIFLVFFTCRNLKLRSCTSLLACAVTAASPIVVWVAKSALTEGFLGVIMVLFLYFLTDQEHPERQWMSILPVAVFGCFHVSIYTMIPMFVVIYGGMYWFTRRKCFAVLMPVTVLGYLVSFFAMRHVQPFYTMNNYSPIFGIGITQKELPWFVPLVCAVALVLCGIYIWAVRRFVHRKYAHLSPEGYLERFRSTKTGFFLIEALLILLVLFILVRCFMADSPLATFRGTAFWGYVCNTGFFLLAAAWILGVLRPRFYLESPQRLVVLVTAFYCVLFYAAFLRFEVQYFYYYGRYLAPFIPVAALFGGMTIDRLRARVTLPVMAAGLVAVAPYDRFLAVMKDDTRLEWDVLEETAAQITSEDCVIVDSDAMWTLYLPLRAMTGAAAYPVLGDDLAAQAEELSQTYDTVYYIGKGEWTEAFDDQFQLVYSNDVTQYNDDNVSGRGRISPLPLEYQITEDTVTMYRYLSERLEYPAEECAAEEYRGFGSLEQDFCWSNTEDAAVRCQLSSEDYTLTITMGCLMPLEALELESYPVTVQINGETAGTVTVDESNNGESLSLDIPAELVQDGQNIVTLHCDLWKAERVAAGDARELGFPLESLVFTPIA